MDNLPELRKNIKFFAGGKNQPLVDLSSMVFDGDKVVSIEAIPEPKENNTLLKLVRDLYPTAVENPWNVTDDDRYKRRTITYNRMALETSLRLAFERNESGNFVITTNKPHPLSTEDVIEVLNTKYGFDMSTDDITVTHTGNNRYTLASKANSLCFFGTAGTEIGEDSIDPEPKVSSHDALIVADSPVDVDTSWRFGIPLNVNGNAIDHSSIVALDAAGLICFNYAKPESMPSASWAIFTGLVETTVAGETTTTGVSASELNINETIKVTDRNVNFKLIPFVRETTRPLGTDYVDFDGGLILNFQPTLAAILDKLFLVFVDGAQTRLVDIMNGTVPGLSLTAWGEMDSVIRSTDSMPHQVILQGHIASLPALIDDTWRTIDLRDSTTTPPLQPLDDSDRELYLINILPEVIPQPNPSTVTPVVVTVQGEFNAVMEKLGKSITQLPWSTYSAQTYHIQAEDLEYEFTAHLDTLSYPNFFPFTYFIDAASWSMITSQASEAYLGSLTINPVGGNTTTVDITPAYLQARAVATTGGMLIALLVDLPANSEMVFVLDWDLLGTEYGSTTTVINVKIDHTKPSLIAPVPLTEALMNELFPMEDEVWKQEQLLIERVITPNNGKYTVDFKMPPGSNEVPN